MPRKVSCHKHLGSVYGKTIRFLINFKLKSDTSLLYITGDIPYNDGKSLRAFTTTFN